MNKSLVDVQTHPLFITNNMHELFISDSNWWMIMQKVYMPCNIQNLPESMITVS